MLQPGLASTMVPKSSPSPMHHGALEAQLGFQHWNRLNRCCILSCESPKSELRIHPYQINWIHSGYLSENSRGERPKRYHLSLFLILHAVRRKKEICYAGVQKQGCWVDVCTSGLLFINPTTHHHLCHGPKPSNLAHQLEI